ncbi:Bug family tripartite tricarboxylate transporter substrate binding protein [Bordetella bronchiseptica]|uniref:Bug family tripartite tricarboxylate transporter substrate binding protein n=1 Tax=Bordetella bronchiseptica TaxID=518 RepID=UPI0002905390|nr:tripartite tricarboxylate transporter substrate binding protein [Bordetella bronchiseptica]AWP85103.1 MFS transporter [Bordetella bronchiseptica]AWQ10677.1 MFS transporter [Bordetella bronchiseptica]AXT89319.1 tripartite tricarboxylate transporter substrate binding protein [Bordetella bronchiseptica]KDB63920.1 tripartite tricarboxylate transporter family receptor [Bordetella bronchiseptica B18-5 (C3)]KDB77798.1 tripartite tricarboxylate transporter family receptor [Bordetella bronchiseptica
MSDRQSARLPRRAALCSMLALCAGFALQPVAAQSAYPDRPIRMIVPYPPGGATDVIGRVLAKEMSGALGQSVVVENRAGAAGNIGADVVAKATPDGYTILMGAMTSHAINAVLYQGRVSYDIEKSFAPVAIVGTVPLVFVVNPAVPADSLQSLIALAKSKPGYLTMASAGNGSPQHLAGEMFKRVAGVDLLHVPYKGSGPAMTDLMGGQVLSMIETVPAAQGNVKGGKLRALAVASAQRVESLPDVPTTAEAGLPNFQVSSMFGIAAPAGTPAPVVERLNAVLKEALAKPEVQTALLNQGAISTWTTPADAAARISAERKQWAGVIAEAGVKAE